MATQDIRSLQTRTASEHASMARFIERQHGLSLLDVINAKLQFPTRTFDPAAVQAASAISEACRQYSGVAPLGQWVPLQALARGLDTTAGAAAIVHGVSKEIGSSLAQTSAVVGAGATILSGLNGSSVTLPGIDTAIDATGSAWVSEGAPAPQREPSFSGVSLVPRTLSVEIVISRTLLRDGGAALDAQLRGEILRQVMAEIDRAAINGAGSATEPEGILKNSAVQVVSAGTNGAAPTWAHVVELEYQVSQRMGLAGMRAPAFLSNPAVTKKLRTTQRATGLDFILPESGTLMGRTYGSTTAVPANLTKGTATGVCSALIFGDMAEVFVGFWGPSAVDLLVDGYTLSARNAVRIIARADVGVAIRTPAAFCAYKDFLTA